MIWSLEVVAVAVLNADVGGVEVLLDLLGPLARWGLGYLVVGAVLGLGRPWAGAWAGLAWLGLVAVADTGVAPRGVMAALVVAGLVAAEPPIRRLGERAKRVGLAVVAVTLVLVSLSKLRPVPQPDGRSDAGPDVVVVVVDTLRADHVGAYGYGRATSPHIDALAAEGRRFTAARSTASWTLPAHASLFTGVHPSAHGAHASHPVLAPDRPTLAETLDARGYRTVGLSANAWVSGGTGLDRGFERFSFLGADAISSQLLLPLVLWSPEDLGGRALTDAAVAEISAAAARDERLFLFVNYLEAHEPLGTMPEPARSRFADGPVDPTLGRRWVRELPYFWCACSGDVGALDCREGLYRASDARVQQTVQRYDAGVAYVDARIGELRAALERAGRLDDTVFVVTSDHGEHLGEDGRLGHMVWLTEPLVRIPLVVRGPGVPAGVDDRPMDLAGLHGWLLSVLDGAEPSVPSVAVAETHPHPVALRSRWGALFGCDFGPAGLYRRLEVGPGGVRRDEGPGATVQSAAPLSPATRAALEALGYVQ